MVSRISGPQWVKDSGEGGSQQPIGEPGGGRGADAQWRRCAVAADREWMVRGTDNEL